jgi:acyl-CoA thioesterase
MCRSLSVVLDVGMDGAPQGGRTVSESGEAHGVSKGLGLPVPAGGSPAGTASDARSDAIGAVHDLYAADAAARALGIEIHAVEPGRAVVTMLVTADMVNGLGLGHGGYVFLLADTACAFASQSAAGASVSRQAEIAFVSPARQGEVLQAVANRRYADERSGIYDVTVTGVGGVVRAEMRGHSQLIRQGARSTPAPGTSA